MEIVQSLLTKMGIFRKPQMKALTTLFATILIACGKVNFTNLSRYSQRTERSYRRQFNKQFDFALFNGEVIKAATPLHHPMIAVMDCSFIAKSGKKTFGLDLFYNGSHSRVERGLEVSLVAVVDVETEMGYALLAEQTFEGAMRFCGMIPNWVRSQGKRIMSTRSSNCQQAPNSRISQCLLTRI